MSGQKWTRKFPTKFGTYHVRNEKGEIYTVDCNNKCDLFEHNWPGITHWCGPIEIPTFDADQRLASEVANKVSGVVGYSIEAAHEIIAMVRYHDKQENNS